LTFSDTNFDRQEYGDTLKEESKRGRTNTSSANYRQEFKSNSPTKKSEKCKIQSLLILIFSGLVGQIKRSQTKKRKSGVIKG
jgi:hypothetical protein